MTEELHTSKYTLQCVLADGGIWFFGGSCPAQRPPGTTATNAQQTPAVPEKSQEQECSAQVLKKAEQLIYLHPLSKLPKSTKLIRSRRLLGLDKAVACTQHMEVGTVVLVDANGLMNAQGPSNEHLWTPLGKQERLKCPSAHRRVI